MTQFRFIGDPRANGHGPDSVVIRGFSFGRDAWTEVPDAIAPAFSGHTHLERASEQAPVTEAPKRRGRPPKVKADE